LERRRKSWERGFSLLEVFVALLILSLGILFLAMGQMTALSAKAPFISPNARTATDLAQEAIDRLFQVTWDELRSSHPDGFQAGPGGVSPAFSRLAASSGDSVNLRGTTFFRVWQVTPDPEVPRLKTIIVWCCWRSGNSSWRQAMLVTQRADGGY
jgi:prepilin-type N-terminal cleavage/methylation domain-containing protein